MREVTMNINEIMQDTCWQSLSYCCSLEKNCVKRDNVMKKLNLTRTEYRDLKEKFDEALQKMKE